MSLRRSIVLNRPITFEQVLDEPDPHDALMTAVKLNRGQQISIILEDPIVDPQPAFLEAIRTKKFSAIHSMIDDPRIDPSEGFQIADPTIRQIIIRDRRTLLNPQMFQFLIDNYHISDRILQELDGISPQWDLILDKAAADPKSLTAKAWRVIMEKVLTKIK